MNIQPILDHFQQLSPEEQTKEVYAHFGLAVYFGQAVEQQLANMLIFDKLFQVKPETPEQYSALFEEYAAAAKPAGILAIETQMAYQLADADRDELQQVLMLREYLADTYFKVHAQRLLQPEQKGQLVADFADFQARARALHNRLQQYQQQYVERTGVDADLMQQTWATVVRDMQRTLGS
ncbi:hypothetical protein D3Y59_01715 [Hymenobacter oligotrophus]|uniref:Uncharacterized protein n=1 Tax=Hymenobacter oligotrophus TaxID=2319843 RepID=A0A3B7R876_9BACT|nr:hypothetical protein [Hymenobacter oligotrophus]AYA35876.1 hypothetical protein D3Y59_01715 [Hymenobacter oligotrophus]